jgi:hypothetical protein
MVASSSMARGTEAITYICTRTGWSKRKFRLRRGDSPENCVIGLTESVEGDLNWLKVMLASDRERTRVSTCSLALAVVGSIGRYWLFYFLFFSISVLCSKFKFESRSELLIKKQMHKQKQHHECKLYFYVVIYLYIILFKKILLNM